MPFLKRLPVLAIGGKAIRILFALLISVGIWAFVELPDAHAKPVTKKVEYQNFDPNGRLATLEQEAEVSAAQAAVKQQRMDRDMIIQTIMQAAAQEGQDPALLLAIAMVESRLDPSSTSPRGAEGLMQLMPQTARRFGCRNSFDAYQNAVCGARYVGYLLNRYDGDLQLALAAYNAGPAPVDRLSEVPPIPQTQAFVQKVTQLIDVFRLELP
jgi:soluble lytic murein transglycosylase-like protein